MKNFATYFQVVRKILSTRYTIDRFSLLLYYLKFLIKSFYHARIKTEIPEYGFRESLFGFVVCFPSFPEFIQLFEEIFVFEVYKFKSSVRSPFIIDCGSNIGISVLYFKMIHPECRIIAFEPEATNFSYLQKNITLNNLNGVVGHKVGLSNATGKAELYRNFSSPSLNWMLHKPNGKYERQEILLEQLSRYVDQEVHLLKIDVEGAEELIVEDLRVNGKIKLISTMIIEYHPTRTNLTFAEFLKQLEAGSFDCQITKPNLIVATRKIINNS